MFQRMPENILLSDSSLFSLSREDENVYLTVNSKASLEVKEIYASTVSGGVLNLNGTGESLIQGYLTVNRLLPRDSESSIGDEDNKYEYGYFENLTVSSLDVENLSVTQRLNISGRIQELTVQDNITTHKLSVDNIHANGLIEGELNTFLNDPHTLPIGGLCFLIFTGVDYLERGEILYLYEETPSGYFWRLSSDSTVTGIVIGLCSIDGTTYDYPSSTHSDRPYFLKVGDRIQILSHGYKKTVNGTTKFVPCLAIRLQNSIEE